MCPVPITDSVRAGMTADLLEYAHYSLGKITEVGFCRKNFINGIFVLFSPTLVMNGHLIRFVLVREQGRVEPIGREF